MGMKEYNSIIKEEPLLSYWTNTEGEENNHEEITYDIENEISLGGSGGNLPKWQLRDKTGFLYAKGRSKDSTYEPEAEVCAYKLALLFGVPAVKYTLVKLPRLTDRPVCISRDYSNGHRLMSLFRYVELVKRLNPSKLCGKEKYELVTSVLPEKDIVLHDSILYFDYIIGNKDRHLRNFDVRVTDDGRFIDLVDMFDTGASLFSDETVDDIRRACGSGGNFVRSKPYGDPHMAQLRIMRELGCKPMLKQVSKVSIYKTINACFNYTGDDRAKYLGQYAVRNAERLGLLWKE